MDDQFYFYDPAQGHGLSHDPLLSIVGPRPIGWISTVDGHGGTNLAPYSFFNAFNVEPPIIGFCSLTEKDTLRNIRYPREFCWNLCSLPLASAMNASSASVAPDIDEFILAGLTPVPSRNVRPPRVLESPVSFQCRLTQTLRLKALDKRDLDSWVSFGPVTGVHIRKDLVASGNYEGSSVQPVLRGGGPGDYFFISDAAKFQMESHRPKSKPVGQTKPN